MELFMYLPTLWGGEEFWGGLAPHAPHLSRFRLEYTEAEGIIQTDIDNRIHRRFLYIVHHLRYNRTIPSTKSRTAITLTRCSLFSILSNSDTLWISPSSASS